MPVSSPATATLVSGYRSSIEGELNKDSPAAEKAYNKVQAAALGMSDRALYAMIEDRIAATSALTAQGDDLDARGAEVDEYRDLATAWRGTASFPADDGTTVPLSRIFVGPQGLQYQAQAAVTAPVGASGSGVTLDLLCLQAGVAGNLQAGDVLTIQDPLAGAGRVATVTVVTVIGAEKEEDEDFRPSVLDAERADGGGGNSSDLRSWAQKVVGVRRAYPFTGPYVGYALQAYPGMRSVYVEAAASIDPDGIAPQSLLDAVKAAILSDLDTGVPREILGLIADTLYVRSIIRTPIFTTVVGMSIRTGSLGSAQSAVSAAVDTFLRRFAPYVQGLDPDFERLDDVTANRLSREVQGVLDAYGGSAQNVLLGTTPGVYLGHYAIAQNERLKSGGVIFQAGT
jgi:hypothetical protein